MVFSAYVTRRTCFCRRLKVFIRVHTSSLFQTALHHRVCAGIFKCNKFELVYYISTGAKLLILAIIPTIIIFHYVFFVAICVFEEGPDTQNDWKCGLILSRSLQINVEPRSTGDINKESEN